MTNKQKRLITILEIVQVENYVRTPELQWLGRKLVERYPIARAFVAKAVHKFPTTRALIEGLDTMPNLRSICGFTGSGFKTVKEARTVEGMRVVEYKKKITLPSESTFSRAFAQFSESALGARSAEFILFAKEKRTVAHGRTHQTSAWAQQRAHLTGL